MSATVEDRLAEYRANQQRKLVADRQRIVLFALESIAGDGLPRVSWYTVEHLMGEGLIEPVGDRFRLTAEGRIALQANPAEGPASDELALFGALP
ncbi:hypothetical protein [Mycolicibacterium conceptionense]|uniref:hypothetical protein n=1 Tax=Mycolicibacterium conceptionense TaxID=451644 RepID=UPI00096F35EB|nr:hypothetical protein [Mycolicibacterium conceptionense]OMB79244.1 hypothetical protein A5743_14155 [Mycolicibacterium conceptionense]